jgi:basic amino acid/polyamine antiporter, APA family
VTEPALKRTLGLWQVSAAGIGVILVAGVTAALTAYSYARIGVMQPKASPEFQYTALAFGPRVGFVAGWLMLVADVSAAAAVSLGFGGYLAHVAGTPVILNALLLLVAVAIIAYAGVAESVALALVLTAVGPRGCCS